jgi:hypothetical protein
MGSMPGGADGAVIAGHEHQEAPGHLDGRIMGADMRAQAARETAQKVIWETDRAKAEAWFVRMEGYGGARRSRLRRSANASTVVPRRRGPPHGWRNTSIPSVAPLAQPQA